MPLQPTKWTDVVAAVPVNWTSDAARPALESVECCDMMPDHDLIADWWEAAARPVWLSALHTVRPAMPVLVA
jgi:hypothetical protein